MSDEVPHYIQYGAFTNGPAPYASDDALLYVFFLEGDHDRLRTLLDRVFAEPTAGAHRYHPIGRHVMLTVGNMPVRSVPPPFDQMGYVDELHAALWILTAAVEERHRHLVPLRLVSFVPMILVANPLSVIGGREVMGYNKAWGDITLPDPAHVDAFAVDGFGGPFAPDSKAGPIPLLRIQRDHTALAPRALGGLREAAEHVHDAIFERDGDELVVPGLRLARSVFDQIRHHTIGQVFLRQFRSPVDGTRASPQQVVEATSTIHDPHVDLLPHAFDIAIHSYDSHPLAEELGLTDQRVAWAMRVRMAFEQGAGEILWQA